LPGSWVMRVSGLRLSSLAATGVGGDQPPGAADVKRANRDAIAPCDPGTSNAAPRATRPKRWQSHHEANPKRSKRKTEAHGPGPPRKVGVREAMTKQVGRRGPKAWQRHGEARGGRDAPVSAQWRRPAARSRPVGRNTARPAAAEMRRSARSGVDLQQGPGPWAGSLY
jgi:hypothetical protein